MSLFLWQNQIGTKWSTGGATMSKQTYEIMSIDENQYELCGFFWIGYALNVPAVTARPAVNDIYHQRD